jgi:hypothetical protein
MMKGTLGLSGTLRSCKGDVFHFRFLLACKQGQKRRPAHRVSDEASKRVERKQNLERHAT